jgi:hypothetical protein
MENIFKECLWKNFGASIEMLSDVIALCPEEIWEKDRRFYYMSYHVVIFLDYYLSQPVREFRPSLPYTLGDPDDLPEGAVDDVLPDRHYTKAEFAAWLAAIRSKCKGVILGASEKQFMARWIQDEEIEMHGLCPGLVEQYSLLEILFYNFRHVQHHVGQLNLLLRDKANKAAAWVAEVE